MANVAEKKSSSQVKQSWWRIQQLIFGADLPSEIKSLLLVILYHQGTNGFAFASQKLLAWELNTFERNIRRWFADAKVLGVVRVERIRKGKKDRPNHYWIDIGGLETQQRIRPEHRPSMDGGTDRAPSTHGLCQDPSTVQNEQEHRPFSTGAPSTHGRSSTSVKSSTAITSVQTPSAANDAARVSPTVAFPSWLPIPQWTAFLKMRKDKRNPAKDYQQEILIRQLTAMRADGHDITAIIEKSTANGWQGFVAPNKPPDDPNERSRSNLINAGLNPDTEDWREWSMFKKPN